MPCTVRPGSGKQGSDMAFRKWGWIYTAHFNKAIGGEGRNKAQHYSGWALDVDTRIAQHKAGRGAAITAYLAQQGIDFEVVTVWPGTREMERQLKKHSATRRCPKCNPGAKEPQVIADARPRFRRWEARQRAKARKEAAEQENKQKALAPKEPKTNAQKYADGARSGALFVQQRLDAGWSAEQIQDSAREITSDADQSSPSQRGFLQQVADDLALARQLEAQDEQDAASLREQRQACQQRYENALTALADRQELQNRVIAQQMVPQQASWLPTQAELEEMEAAG